MVFFNYATMQMAAKIVYYGPGLCGKTTNLHVIYNRTAPNSRGEMVSLETETDRTLFFDLLPLDVGVIGGFKTRLQLYTVPGQVFYNTTRKLVLKGVDGVVFVADSQRPMLEPNRESFRNLKENLAEIGLTLGDIPLVLQYNKRDLSNILSVDELNDALNPDRTLEWHESSAANGMGVFETLKGISKLTLKSIRAKMSGDLRRPAVVATPATPPVGMPALPATPPVAEAKAPARAEAPPPAAQPPAPAPAPPLPEAEPPRPAGPPTSETMARLSRFSEIAGLATPEPEAAPPPPAAAEAPAEEPFPLAAVAPPARADEEPAGEISFGEAEPPETPPAAELPLKHVRVRSSIDILSELDKLRKVATQKPTGTTGAFPAVSALSARGEPHPAAKSSPSLSIQDLLGTNHKKSLSRSFELGVSRDAIARSRQATVAIRLVDALGGAAMPEKTFVVDLSDVKDLDKLLVSLKLNVRE